MKKIYLVIILLLSNLYSYAQLPLDDFFRPGTSWCEQESYTPYKEQTIFFYLHFAIGGDTVVNNTSYHLIYLSTRNRENSGLDNPTMIGGLRTYNDTVSFIRLNTLPAQISFYFVGPYNRMPMGTEQVLYDYTMDIGDNIAWCGYPHKVKSKEPFQLDNGVNTEKINLEGFYPDMYMIKGVGSPQGLFAPLTQVLYNRALFYDNDVARYSYNIQNIQSADLCFPLSAKQIEDTPPLTIYPNPVTTDEITIESPTITRLFIVDMTGKLLYTTSNLPEGKHTIQAPATPGIYILSAQLADGTLINRKIIRQ